MNRDDNDVWSVSDHEFPRDGSREEQLRFLLRYAVLAPSTHNSQPWKFEIRDDGIAIWADWSRAMPALDPGGREVIMSCGAALFHLRVAARHFGYDSEVEAWPQGPTEDLVATLRLGSRGTASLQEHRLFAAIRKRRTHRGAFEKDPVPDAELEQLSRAAETEGATLHVVREVQQPVLADLIDEADQVLGRSPDVRRDWANWLTRQSRSADEGIPGSARGWGTVRTHATPFFIRLPGTYPHLAPDRRAKAAEAPVLLVLGTPDDSNLALLQAGQALDRVLLLGRLYGLYASFLNQPLKIDRFRSEVADVIDSDTVPQVILRMGYGRDQPDPTPRQRPENVERRTPNADDGDPASSESDAELLA